MEWFFDGLGTLLIGLIVGGAGGCGVGWKLAVRRFSQNQRAGDSSTQVQVGRNQRTETKK